MTIMLLGLTGVLCLVCAIVWRATQAWLDWQWYRRRVRAVATMNDHPWSRRQQRHTVRALMRAAVRAENEQPKESQ